MLKLSFPVAKFAAWILPGVWLGLMGWLFLFTSTWNRESYHLDGTYYFVDGDCYARMNRVRELVQGGVKPVRYHAWENHPAGVSPHTTMPMDICIFLLASIFCGSEALSLAGAWVSPILGLLLVLVVGGWLIVGRRPGWWLATLMAVGSPILAHGFAFGRPDHQSLLLLVVGSAWIAQVEALRRRSGGWHGVAGLLWALACWVSLFEPLILSVASVAFLAIRSVQSRLSEDWRNTGVEVLVFGLVFAMWFAIDGRWPAAFPEGFELWGRTIGELRPAGLSGLAAWAGWFVLLVPAGLWWSVMREGGATRVYLALMVTGLWVAAFFQARWGYFFVLALVVAMPMAVEQIRSRLAMAVIVLIGFWPVAGEWERMLYPSSELRRSRAENQAEAKEVRQAALELSKRVPGGVAAPWWICPAVTWWSGLPCTAGTSHQSLPGTRATMAFFLSDDPNAEREFLASRRVKYVLACDPRRVVENAEAILGVQAKREALAGRLFSDRGDYLPLTQGPWVRSFEVPAVEEDAPAKSGTSHPARSAF